MKKNIIFLILGIFTFTNLFSKTKNILADNTKISTNVFLEYSLLEIEFFKNGEGELRKKNVNSTVFGLRQNFKLQNNFILITSIGISEGFDYNFLSTSLGFNMSSNFNLMIGGGGYLINDEKWATVGLDGNEPSDFEFGLNFGINLMLNNNLGISMKYNIIEPKEEESNGSMSLNGLSFGIVLK